MKDNADIRLRAEIERLRAAGQRPRLLVQCCCAPCSSHVLTLLAQGYACTAFFYNPNIMPQAEFDLRLAEAYRLLLDTDLRVREIAERCGFSDIYYFSRLVRRRFGMSPMGLRASRSAAVGGV